MTDGNRAVDICYMKIREVVAKGEILPEWIKGTDNPSDLLTKSVKKEGPVKRGQSRLLVGCRSWEIEIRD